MCLDYPRTFIYEATSTGERIFIPRPSSEEAKKIKREALMKKVKSIFRKIRPSEGPPTPPDMESKQQSDDKNP